MKIPNKNDYTLPDINKYVGLSINELVLICSVNNIRIDRTISRFNGINRQIITKENLIKLLIILKRKTVYMKTLKAKKYFSSADITGYLGVSHQKLKKLCDNPKNKIKRIPMKLNGSGNNTLCIDNDNLERIMIVLGYVKTTYNNSNVWSSFKKMKKIEVGNG